MLRARYPSPLLSAVVATTTTNVRKEVVSASWTSRTCHWMKAVRAFSKNKHIERGVLSSLVDPISWRGRKKEQRGLGFGDNRYQNHHHDRFENSEGIHEPRLRYNDKMIYIDRRRTALASPLPTCTTSAKWLTTAMVCASTVMGSLPSHHQHHLPGAFVPHQQTFTTTSTTTVGKHGPTPNISTNSDRTSIQMNPSTARGGGGPQNAHTRLFSSLFDNNDNRRRRKKKDKGFLSKLKDKTEKIGSQILPSVFGTPDEVELKQRRREAKAEVKSGIQQVLKDAPLPIRMMGGLVAPLISSMASSFQEQGEAIQDVIDRAGGYITSDPQTSSVLGEPLEVGMPFSQSSSSMNINGKQSSEVRASFEVMGSRSSGVATVTARGQDGQPMDVLDLVVQVNGRTYNVDTTRSTGGSSVYSSSSSSSGGEEWGSKGASSNLGKNSNVGKDDVIDAEFVEKKTKY